MNTEGMPKGMMTIWKQSWESYLKTVEAMQDQGDKMMEMMIGQNPVLPDEAKKMMEDWAINAKKMQKAYLDMAQENLKKMEDFTDKN